MDKQKKIMSEVLFKTQRERGRIARRGKKGEIGKGKIRAKTGGG